MKDCPIIDNKEPKANIALDSVEKDDSIFNFSLSTSHSNEWILDFGYSIHVFSHRLVLKL